MVDDLLSVKMLEKSLDPIFVEVSLKFVGILVQDGDLHDVCGWLSCWSHGGHLESLVEVCFMLSFELLSWLLLCHGILFIVH